jgi:hypothetical protein
MITKVVRRRWTKLATLLKILAFTNGRTEIALSDCFMLLYACWQVRSEFEELKQWLNLTLRDRIQNSANKLQETQWVSKHVWLPNDQQNGETALSKELNPQEQAKLSESANQVQEALNLKRTEEENAKREAKLRKDKQAAQGNT